MDIQYDRFLADRNNFVEPDRLVELGPADRLVAGLFEPDGPARGVLIFYHGGAASMSGYGGLANQVRNATQFAVLTPDIRGHGRSSGPRGFAATPETVWDDVEAAVVWATLNFPGCAVFVGGHSSGGGLVLNWASQRQTGAAPLAGLVFVAPLLWARRPKPANAQQAEFAHARPWVFFLYFLSGKRLMAHADAVRFSFPEGIAESGQLVPAYSPGMSLAVTPMKAADKLRQCRCPVLMVAAADDEMFDVESLRTAAGDASFAVVPGTHLSCFLTAAEPVAAFLTDHTR